MTSMMVVDFALDQLAVADMGLLAVLDIVVVIFVYCLLLNYYYQIPVILSARPEFVCSTVDFVPANDKP